MQFLNFDSKFHDQKLNLPLCHFADSKRSTTEKVGSGKKKKKKKHKKHKSEKIDEDIIKFDLYELLYKGELQTVVLIYQP